MQINAKIKLTSFWAVWFRVGLVFMCLFFFPIYLVPLGQSDTFDWLICASMLRAINIHQPQPKSRGKKKPTVVKHNLHRLLLPPPSSRSISILYFLWDVSNKRFIFTVKCFFLVLSIRLPTPKLFTCIRNGKRKPLAKHVQVVSLSGRHAHCYQDKLFLLFFVLVFFTSLWFFCADGRISLWAEQRLHANDLWLR